MAQQGYYPDPPSRRMAYDQDGTIVLAVRGNLSEIRELSQGERQTINDEGGSNIWLAGGSNRWNLTFLFPEKRNVTHYYAAWQKDYHYASVSGGVVEWSNDTTNGADGNWNIAANSWQANSNNGGGATAPNTTAGFPDMRMRIETLPVDGVKAIRFAAHTSHDYASGIFCFTHHLYGHKAAGQTPHRLDFVYADGSELLQDFDYGDQPRGTERIWSPIEGYNIGSPLYLRNRSPEKVASDVTLVMQNLTGNMINRLALSKDNISYGTQLTWVEIQPLQSVGPVYVRHLVPDDTSMGLYTARFKLEVGEWI